jgi:hypothetical protein
MVDIGMRTGAIPHSVYSTPDSSRVNNKFR